MKLFIYSGIFQIWEVYTKRYRTGDWFKVFKDVGEYSLKVLHFKYSLPESLNLFLPGQKPFFQSINHPGEKRKLINILPSGRGKSSFLKFVNKVVLFLRGRFLGPLMLFSIRHFILAGLAVLTIAGILWVIKQRSFVFSEYYWVSGTTCLEPEKKVNRPGALSAVEVRENEWVLCTDWDLYEYITHTTKEMSEKARRRHDTGR